MHWKDRPYAPFIAFIESALRRAWSRETCSPGDRQRWTPENPSIGQCGATVAMLHKCMTEGRPVKGLKIMRAVVNGFGSHYWLRLPDGTDIDLTRDQFPEGTRIPEGEERSIEYLLDSERAVKARTRERAELLNERMEKVVDLAHASFEALGFVLG